MRVIQVFNNNVVLTRSNEKEVIVFGTGIGFQKKKGDLVNKNSIEKVFKLENNDYVEDIAALYSSISEEEIATVFAIVESAKDELKMVLSDSIYPSLADHMHYVIKRNLEGISTISPLHDEVKNLYPKAYNLMARHIVTLNDKFHTNLSNEEASAMVLHFLNASRGEPNMKETLEQTKITKDILEIIDVSLGVNGDYSTIDYERLIVHLHFFARRVVSKKVSSDNNPELVELVLKNYYDAYQCAKRVETYLKTKHDYALGTNELVYLTIHIQRITQ